MLVSGNIRPIRRLAKHNHRTLSKYYAIGAVPATYKNMPYLIIDAQGMGTHEGEVFDSKEEIRQHLINYHSVDFEGEVPIEDYSLKDIQDYGEWDIKKISRQEAKKIKKIAEIIEVKCQGCGEPILEGEMVVNGENRHAVCS